MFGMFKKPDPRKNIDQVRETWAMISVGDKTTVAMNILKVAKGLYDECGSLEEAIAKMIQFKQTVIQQFRLRDHRHPAYLQMEILLEVLIHCSGRTPAQYYAAETLKEVLEPLPSSERSQVQRYLSKFVEVDLS